MSEGILRDRGRPCKWAGGEPAGQKLQYTGYFEGHRLSLSRRA